MSIHRRTLSRRLARGLGTLIFFAALVMGSGGCSDPQSSTQMSGDGEIRSLCEAPATYDDFARPLMEARCLSCHTSPLVGEARQGAPPEINFDSEGDLQQTADRILARSVDNATMPPPSEAPLSDCEQAKLREYLDALTTQGCLPSCTGRVCGDDGCGGSCGECEAGGTCDEIDGQCAACVPDCTGRVCGDDGCGGSCGECMGASDACTTAGSCECAADCTGRECGGDGCGGSCGAPCPMGLTCQTRDGFCTDSCEPDCTGRVCGDDGCNDSCGDCPGENDVCTAAGICACAPDCTGRVCGDDGCGGSCGACPAANEVCEATAGVCECVPDCTGRACGGDGCGGVCGAGCSAGQSCIDGACQSIPTFSGDIEPMFEAMSCTKNGCHTGRNPSADLELTLGVAYGELVGVPSIQCTNLSLVEAGDSSSSYLINKVTGVDLCSGNQMPKTGSPLTPQQVDLIRGWIDAGAAND